MNIGNASNLVDVKITGNLSVTSTVTASTFVGALSKAITIGGKSYDGHEAISVSATDLGLSNAMHFVGTTTVTNPTGNYNNGDVILNTSTKKEYVYTNNGRKVNDRYYQTLDSVINYKNDTLYLIEEYKRYPNIYYKPLLTGY